MIPVHRLYDTCCLKDSYIHQASSARYVLVCSGRALRQQQQYWAGPTMNDQTTSRRAGGRGTNTNPSTRKTNLRIFCCCWCLCWWQLSTCVYALYSYNQQYLLPGTTNSVRTYWLCFASCRWWISLLLNSGTIPWLVFFILLRSLFAYDICVYVLVLYHQHDDELFRWWMLEDTWSGTTTGSSSSTTLLISIYVDVCSWMDMDGILLIMIYNLQSKKYAKKCICSIIL